jgi:hypothetical protein
LKGFGRFYINTLPTIATTEVKSTSPMQWAHVLRGDQLHLLPMRLDLASPMMCAAARLEDDHTIYHHETFLVHSNRYFGKLI